MTVTEAKRLLTERGAKMGWLDKRTDLSKDHRFSLGLVYNGWILREFGPSVQAAYDAMLAQMAETDNETAVERQEMAEREG